MVAKKKEVSKYQELDDYIEKLGLGYSAVFVPFSKSRNADNKDWICINWDVQLSTGTHSSQVLKTSYAYGIGNLKGYVSSWSRSGWKNEYYRRVAEIGKYNTEKVLPKFSSGKTDWWYACERVSFTNKVPVNPPLLRDVLYALISEARVLDHSCFEEWATEYGYDTDSRKAEGIYRECLESALKLRSLLGDKKLSELQTLFEDY